MLLKELFPPKKALPGQPGTGFPGFRPKTPKHVHGVGAKGIRELNRDDMLPIRDVDRAPFRNVSYVRIGGGVRCACGKRHASPAHNARVVIA